jgi:small multidrug resistance family-3 protein
MTNLVQSIALFIVAGLCEIAGGYLVWQAIRGGKGWPFGVIGGLLLMLYGVLPTFQQRAGGGSIWSRVT